MENTSRHIATKFELAAQIVEKIGAGSVLGLELTAIHSRYVLSTSHLFLYTARDSGRPVSREEFQRIVAAQNFLGDLDYLVRRASVALRNATLAGPAGKGSVRGGAPPPACLQETRALYAKYQGYAVDCAARAVEHSCITHGEGYNVCPECQVAMSVSSETSELVCNGCGTVRELVGTIFDDAQFYNQEGQKAKSGSFNPNRHFRFWLDRILARESEEELGDRDDPENTCGEKLLDQLRGAVRRDRKILRLLTVDNVRAMLKEIGRTDLNKNVPLIMRRLTGVGPPQLPESICQRVEKLFSKALEIGERVRPSGRTNRNYYPYYIYKILDAVLPEDTPGNPEAREYRRVLYYIYMQGQETLDKNDREWEQICQEMPEIDWTTTNRSKAQKYRPI